MIFTEKRVLYILAGVLLLTSFIDIFTAVTSPVFEIAESNPIFVISGTKVPLLIVSVLFVFWILKKLRDSVSLYSLFVFSLAAIYLSFGHMVGAYSNIAATKVYYENPQETTEAYQSMTAKQKIVAYNMVVGVFIILPAFLSYMAFLITLVLYRERQPKRERLMKEVYELSREAVLK